MAIILTTENKEKSEKCLNLVDLSDAENPKNIILSVERPYAVSLQKMGDVITNDSKKYYSILGIEDEMEEVETFVDPELFETEFQSPVQLTRQGAERVAEKIRRTKIMLIWIPDSAKETYDCPQWHKSFLYIPVALMAGKYVTPLLIEQNGIWAITGEGLEFELVARFEVFNFFSLAPFSPENLARELLSVAKREKVKIASNANWWTLSAGEQETGLRKYSLSFQEYCPDEQLGHLLIVAKAMIDVWMPHVLASIDKPSFFFHNDMFKEFENFEDIVAWSVSDDTSEEKEISSYIIPGSHSSVVLEKVENSVPLLDNPDFKTAISNAKAIARASSQKELTVLFILCGLLMLKDPGFKFSEHRIKQIKDQAEENNIVLNETDKFISDETMPIDADLKSVLAKSKMNSLPEFALALLAQLG